MSYRWFPLQVTRKGYPVRNSIYDTQVKEVETVVGILDGHYRVIRLPFLFRHSPIS